LQIEGVKLIGINNRNLEDFTVDLAHTQNILAARQEELSAKNITVVSESGLYSKADLDFVQSAGAKAVLIGESLVKQDDLSGAIYKLYN
jgi:indole-3-glycerol phosphate synthase